MQQYHPRSGQGNADAWECPVSRSGISDGSCSLSAGEDPTKKRLVVTQENVAFAAMIMVVALDFV